MNRKNVSIYILWVCKEIQGVFNFNLFIYHCFFSDENRLLTHFCFFYTQVLIYI